VGGIEYITFVRRTTLAAAWPNAQLVKITQPSNCDTVSGAVGIVTQFFPSVSWENIFVDGQNLASSPPKTFTWNSTGASSGSHTIMARAYNSKGQQVGSDSVTVKTNQNADSLSITSPSNGSSVSGNINIVTQTGAGVAWENVYIDNQYLVSSPPYTFAWNSASVPDGSHTISARAFGNNGLQVNSASVTVNTANSAAVKINQPSNGSTVKGITSIVTQVAASVAWENVYIDSHYLASSPPSTFSWNSAGVSNGSHTISSKAFNGKGQQIGSDAVNVNVTN
jgi:hypothetical protein